MTTQREGEPEILSADGGIAPDAADLAAAEAAIAGADAARHKPEADDMLSIPMDNALFNLAERMMTAKEDESELVPWANVSPEQASVLLELDVERQLEVRGSLDYEEFVANYLMLSVAKDGLGRKDAKEAAGAMARAQAGAPGGGGFANRLMGRRGSA